MPDYIDKPRTVREGEELELERLTAYLSDHLPDVLPDPGGDVTVEQFPGGHSNLTYLVRAGDQEYVLRRPPFGSKVKTAHDMSREYKILSALADYPKAPRPVLFCDDHDILGADFYLMERVRGLILRKELPAGLALDPPTARALCESLIDTLAELHDLDFRARGLGDFGRPEGYIERQISGWRRRYEGSQTDDIPAIEAVGAWLAENMPPDGAPSLIHNDFKFDNVVVDPNDVTRIIGILDWEMSTVGDPLMDLGTTLCYWVEITDPQPMQMQRFGPTTLPGMMTRKQLTARYFKTRDLDPVDVTFYYVYGLFKTAVVVQQIYYRWKQGLTKDPRFEGLIHAVGMLADHATAAIDAKR